MEELNIEQKAKRYDDVIRKAKITLDCCTFDSTITEHVVYDIFPELKESEEKKPNSAIVLEDYREGDRFYKVNLAYLSKEQVEEIENIVKKWNHEPSDAEDEKIRKAIIEHFVGSHSSMYLYKGFTKEQIIIWLEKQGEQKPVWREYDERILKTIIIGIENEMFLNVMREKYQRIPNTNKNYHQIMIDWLKSIEQRLKGWDGKQKQLITLDHFEDKGDMVEPKFKIEDKITEKKF